MAIPKPKNRKIKSSMIERLPKEFKGRGDCRNYFYTQVYKVKLSDGKFAYVYEQEDISNGENNSYVAGYEVVKPTIQPKVSIRIVDGKKIVEESEELKEYYPSTEQWGSTGFTEKSLIDAMKKLHDVFDKL